MSAPLRETLIELRGLRAADFDDVVRIDALHTGVTKPDYWRGILAGFTSPDTSRRVGLAAEHAGQLVGYLLGEVRAFEFGSEECGWIFAVGVDLEHLHKGVASALLDEAYQRFRGAGVRLVRTMVGRSNVGVLAFFRANGFVGGSFVQLERDLEEDQ